jgi:hypothetical protein
MKFTLDIPFIRDILEQEHARVRDGPVRTSISNPG